MKKETGFNVRKMRRHFFVQNLFKFLLPPLVPILFFTAVTLWQVTYRIKNEIDSFSVNTLSLSSATFDMMLKDMLYYRILIDSNPSTSTQILYALMEKHPSYETLTALRNLNQTIFSLSMANTYIHSIYIANKNSDYMIHNGERRLINEALDQKWFENYMNKSPDVQAWLEVRKIRNYVFDQTPVNVVSLYQRTRFNGILVINIYQEHFNSLLNSAVTYPGQSLAVLDNSFNIVFENTNSASLPETLLAKAAEYITDGEGDSSSIDSFFFTYRPSRMYGIWFVSFIPEESSYNIITILLRSMILAIILSAVISILLAFYFTQQNYKEIYRIIHIFDLAREGSVLPSPKGKQNNAYFYIIENIVNVFLTQSYMKEQLALRRFELLSAQLAALQYQINPHFLFNTLQSIDLEVRKQDGQMNASKMITQLAGILRYSLEDPMKLVPIGDEIRMAKDYLAIQKYRNKTSFEVIWEYSEKIAGYKTLRLLLQPLLENILSHGVRDDGSPLLIKVRIRKKNNRIYFSIADNGIGIPPDRLKEIREKLKSRDEDAVDHIGLVNINRRLMLQYASEGSGLVVRSKDGIGTVVSFFLGPVQ